MRAKLISGWEEIIEETYRIVLEDKLYEAGYEYMIRWMKEREGYMRFLGERYELKVVRKLNKEDLIFVIRICSNSPKNTREPYYSSLRVPIKKVYETLYPKIFGTSGSLGLYP
jgi:hypothetical protein